MSNNWPENFPPVTSLVPYTALRHNPDTEIQTLYDRAKNHEDREAAAELIDRLVSDEGIEDIKTFASRHPSAVLVSVHAIEGQGRNAIPQTLAHFIAEHAGLDVDNSIVQSSIVSKTGVKSTWYRMVHRTPFEGSVQAGKDYILVDDAFSAGGTFNDLRQFIEKNGGKVVDTITMANGAKSMDVNLAVTKQHILELERKFGVESLQQFLKEETLYDGNYKALTDAEARTLLGSPTLDQARDSMAAARQEGNRRVRPQMVQGTSPDNKEVTNIPDAKLSKPVATSSQQNNYLNIFTSQIKPAPSDNGAKSYKETNMEIESQGKTPAEQAFLTAVHQRKVVADALKSGSLACLPGADGYADTSPAVNIANGTRYHGANLLCLKENQKQNGFPTAEYVTQDAALRFQEETGIGLTPNKQPGQGRGVKIMFSNAGSFESVKLYNVAECAKPEELRKWAAAQLQERSQKKQEYMKAKLGDAYKDYGKYGKKENLPAPEVSPKSAEPEKYLGAYLAAVSMGGKFKPSGEQAAEFSKNMEASMFQRGQNGHTDPFKLSKICNAASEHCKEVIKEVRQGQRREQAQTQTQTQSRGRSM